MSLSASSKVAVCGALPYCRNRISSTRVSKNSVKLHGVVSYERPFDVRGFEARSGLRTGQRKLIQNIQRRSCSCHLCLRLPLDSSSQCRGAERAGFHLTASLMPWTTESTYAVKFGLLGKVLGDHVKKLQGSGVQVQATQAATALLLEIMLQGSPAAAGEGPAVGDLAAGVGLDTFTQALYLGALLILLATGAFLVIRQILIQRELEETAKVVGEKVRSGQASCEEYFELGVVLLRKKAYTMAITNLENALATWEGPEEEQAQAYNALGFAKYKQDKFNDAIPDYRRAVELQPGYVTAWNNLGNSYEKMNQLNDALKAYEEALLYAPDNEVAGQRAGMLRDRLKRLGQL
mmetsp:Transcript_2551/g.2815  ORF Transcript_2551/g.2815 Transcript_2551/m.2815 type:complete len:349 (-) Transcript_2551:150-1196(-)